MHRYGGLDPATLQSLSQQNSMYGMGDGSNAQLMQQLYRGGAAASPDPWAQQPNSLLGASGEHPAELTWPYEQQHVSTMHCGGLTALGPVVAGYQKAGGLPGMQQPALPNLNMASRAGMQPGSSSTMYQQVCNLQQVANTSSRPQHV